MHEALTLAGAVLVCVLGMGWLALAIDTHWRQVRGREVELTARAVTVLRLLGAGALLASVLLCLRVDHASMASLVWVMTLAASALLVAFTLAWRPRWLAVLALGAPAKPQAD